MEIDALTTQSKRKCLYANWWSNSESMLRYQSFAIKKPINPINKSTTKLRLVNLPKTSLECD